MSPESPHLDTALSVPERADRLLAEMTVREKAHQLVSVPPWYLVLADGSAPVVRDEWLEKAPGHISNFGVDDPSTMARIVGDLQRTAIEGTRLGIPLLLHIEALNGLLAGGHMVFPTSIGLAATWSPELVEEMADTIRKQMLAALSVAYTRGLQGDDLRTGAVATAKHGSVRIAATVRNAGERGGDIVAQLYARVNTVGATRPAQQLAGFVRVSLAGGVSPSDLRAGCCATGVHGHRRGVRRRALSGKRVGELRRRVARSRDGAGRHRSPAAAGERRKGISVGGRCDLELTWLGDPTHRGLPASLIQTEIRDVGEIDAT